jgi:D-sedoheptulose 7-phosphate isomerase
LQSGGEDVARAHLAELGGLVASVDVPALERLGRRLHQVRERGGTVFVAGNGGSAATATHFAADLGKATKARHGVRLRAVSLTTNESWLTALSNDEGYERSIAGQLENFITEKDLLLLISASGNSPNLLAAVEEAERHGASTAALLGFDGGRLKERVDDCVHVATEKGEYELVEDVHSAACHALVKTLAADGGAGPGAAP